MKSFYRYIRQVKFVEHRTEVQTLPHGGICLRFDEAPNGGLFFSHARCHSDELFSKDVAKRIVDQRALSRQKHVAYPTVPLSSDTSLLIDSVIEECHIWNPGKLVTTDVWFVSYLRLEFQELAHALEQLMVNNISARVKSEIWQAGLEAAGYKDQYSALSYLKGIV